MVLLLKQSISKIYRADFCTCSYVLCFIFSLIILIVPFFLAASTYGFWSLHESYLEQPIVLDRNEILVVALTESKTISGTTIKRSLQTNYYSTLGEMNELTGTSNIPAFIQSAYWDYNVDYIPDVYDYNITLFLPSANLRNVKIFANYDYRLRSRVNLDMVTLAIADITTPNGASIIYLDGDLSLNQQNPLKSSKIVRKVYNSTLLDNSWPTENFFPILFTRYFSRNETTKYKYTSTILPHSSSQTLEIRMKVRIPPYQEVLYIPNFLQNLKFAWIQYLSLLIPVYYLVSLFAGFVFSQQIFQTATEIKY